MRRSPTAIAARRTTTATSVAMFLVMLLVGLMASLAIQVATAPPASAVEGAVDENVGLEVREPDDPENEFAPRQYEYNYLWGANLGLLVGIGGLFATMGLLYYVKVVRPEQAANS